MNRTGTHNDNGQVSGPCCRKPRSVFVNQSPEPIFNRMEIFMDINGSVSLYCRVGWFMCDELGFVLGLGASSQHH